MLCVYARIPNIDDINEVESVEMIVIQVGYFLPVDRYSSFPGFKY